MRKFRLGGRLPPRSSVQRRVAVVSPVDGVVAKWQRCTVVSHLLPQGAGLSRTREDQWRPVSASRAIPRCSARRVTNANRGLGRRNGDIACAKP